jgi:hypothetical protein
VPRSVRLQGARDRARVLEARERAAPHARGREVAAELGVTEASSRRRCRRSASSARRARRAARAGRPRWRHDVGTRSPTARTTRSRRSRSTR